MLFFFPVSGIEALSIRVKSSQSVLHHFQYPT